MLSVKKTKVSLKEDTEISSENVCYLYELEGPCKDSKFSLALY